MAFANAFRGESARRDVRGMEKSDNYMTLKDLEELSGFKSSTIAYYIQKSLLPRVGKRGKHSSYSKTFRDRLMFIRRVRDLQDARRLRAVTLDEIAKVIADHSGEMERLSQIDVPEETLLGLFSEPSLDTSEIAVSVEDVVAFEESRLRSSERADSLVAMPASARRGAMYSRSSPDRTVIGQGVSASDPDRPTGSLDSELEMLLQEVDRLARIGAKRSGVRTRERLTRVPVTDDIILSVRNIDDDDAHVVEKLAALLRQIGRVD